MAVPINSFIFCDKTPHSSLKANLCFEGKYINSFHDINSISSKKQARRFACLLFNVGILIFYSEDGDDLFLRNFRRRVSFRFFFSFE
jgi:hypothetical protein